MSHYGTIKSEVGTVLGKLRASSELGDGDLRHLQGFLKNERSAARAVNIEPYPTTIPDEYLGLLNQSEARRLLPEAEHYFDTKTNWAPERRR